METKTAKAAGDTLREARKRAGLTIAELAYRAKVSPGTITQYQKYGIPPAPLARWRIAAILGIAAQELFPGTDPLPWERTPAEDANLRKKRQDQIELMAKVPGHIPPAGLFPDGEPGK